MYIVTRRNEDNYQILYDLFQRDGSGEWRASGEGTIDIPLQFANKLRAKYAMTDAIKEEPWWDYEIREYLK